MTLEPSASQTVGPYFHIGLSWLNTDRIAAPSCPGQHVNISGRVLDAQGAGINDAVVEIWQADSHGKYVHPEDSQPGMVTPGFRGFGRVPTDAEGRFRFHTIKPGPVADPHGGQQAPHLLVAVFMRGLLKQAVTRLYFPDEPLNADDRVLRLVPPQRRGTLIPREISAGELSWDIVMQGANETVFFDF